MTAHGKHWLAQSAPNHSQAQETLPMLSLFGGLSLG
jgi:hypothetical protein